VLERDEWSDSECSLRSKAEEKELFGTLQCEDDEEHLSLEEYYTQNRRRKLGFCIGCNSKLLHLHVAGFILAHSQRWR
jgi:hypothetical protein